jgi:hypothetical protein
MATFAQRADGIVWIFTFTDVQPGREYVWNVATGDTYVGDVSVTLPGPFPGATHYYYDIGCSLREVSDPSVPETGGIRSSCVSDPGDAIDVVATAWEQGGNLLAYGVVERVPIVRGGMVSVSVGAWQTDLVDVVLGVSNAPVEAERASVRRSSVRDGPPFLSSVVPIDLQNASAGSGTVRVPPFGDYSDFEVWMNFAPGGEAW